MRRRTKVSRSAYKEDREVAEEVVQASHDSKEEPRSIRVMVSKDLWNSDVQVVKRSLKRLAEVCENNDNNCKEFGRIGGPITVIKAMERHSEDADTQAKGCKALRNLALDDTLDALITDVGGIDIVIKAMKTFPENADLQKQGCGVLYNLTCNKKGHEELIADAGGVSAITLAMTMHPANARIQDIGCDTLCNLCTCGEEIVEEIVSAGGLSAVAKAVENMAEDVEVKDKACYTLGKLLHSVRGEEGL